MANAAQDVPVKVKGFCVIALNTGNSSFQREMCDSFASLVIQLYISSLC